MKAFGPARSVFTLPAMCLALLSFVALGQGPPAQVDGRPAQAVPVPAAGAWTTVGERIPDLELPLIDGSGSFDLAALRGERVLLIQFASW